MKFTDIFIKRPVLACVISLVILLLGVRAFQDLELRQYPKVKDSVIKITTVYPGANADLIKGFITTPLQQAIATADGIDYLEASSGQNVSVITAHIRLDYDPDVAMTDILTKVQQVKSELPSEAQDPVIAKDSASGLALVYLSFTSEKMSNEKITDYLIRSIQPQMSTIEGVSEALILGRKTFAMRIWLDIDKLAALNISAEDVFNVLRANNFQSAAGETKGSLVVYPVDASTDVSDAKDFERLIIKTNKTAQVRLSDIARIELGAESYDSEVIFNGKNAIFIGVKNTPGANPLDVIQRVRDILPDIQRQAPPGLEVEVGYDTTIFIQKSINEVIKTFIEAILIVVLVIFLFIGSFRAVLIPVITIPLSIIGVLFFIYLLGYSINLLTLLAMVLAIGLVVDDAIVVVENIQRHLEEGYNKLDASIMGAREIAMPVITMTTTLAAVYAPIAFMGGLTGALFSEFAFTLAGSVIVSGVVALTLSPMMSSKILKTGHEGKFALFLNRMFDRLKGAYQMLLKGTLNARASVVLVVIVVLLAQYGMFMFSQKELAPEEDQGIVMVFSTAPQYANLDYLSHYTKEIDAVYNEFEEKFGYFRINGEGGPNIAFSGMILKPWDERERTQMEILPVMQQKVDQVAGVQSFAFSMPTLPGSPNGLPIQFVINTTADYAQLLEMSNTLVEQAMASGKFMFLNNTLKFNKPQINVEIDRQKAAELGVSMSEIGTVLQLFLGDGYSNRFDLDGRSYKVIPQAEQSMRDVPEKIYQYRVRTASGKMIPLSTIVTLSTSAQPGSLTQFQQLNSATLEGLMNFANGTSLGDALAELDKIAAQLLPKGYSVDYAGLSRQFAQEGDKLLYTFIFSVILIFLVLSAQFESFRDPFVILITVPLSICGAMVPLFLGWSTLNIYTQIGLITLVGLISKHGILMVDFANQLQRQGMSKYKAIEEAAAIRLRPILMTTGAMVLGVMPLVFSTGAGSVSRFDIGIVIVMGMSFGTLFTLFVIPTMYTIFAKSKVPAVAAD